MTLFLFAYTLPKKGHPQSAFSFFSAYKSSTSAKASLANAFAPQPVTICSGASILIQGDNPTIPPDSYSWEVLQDPNTNTWVNAPGTNNTADYQPSLLVNNTNGNVVFNLRRKITVGANSGYDSYYDVTVQPASPISNNTVSAPAVNSFCVTSTPSTIIGSTPSGGNGAYGYQWQRSTDNVTFSDIAGATTKDYTAPQSNTTTYYRRTVTAGSCVLPTPSNTVAIAVLTVVSNNTITPPTISNFCINGDPAAITGNVPSGGSGSYNYQWQSSTDNINFTDITGATNKDYDPATITATTYYRRAVTSGSCTTPVLSNSITLTILPAITNNTITAPSISTFCVNGDPTAITGNIPTGGSGTYTYQWQRSTNNVTFTDITGATSKDFDPPLATTTIYYRRTAISGLCSTPVISNVVTITVSPLPVTPNTSLPTVTVCPGSAATLSVNAQTGVTYNWYDSPARTNLLFTGSTYVTPAITTSRVFYVESSNGPCVSSALATIQVNTNTPPATPVLANNQVEICSGSSATLSVASPQAGVTYTWYASATGGAALGTGTNFTTPALTANTTYYVEAINAGGCISASRSPVNVSVAPLPQATVQTTAICPGSAATLTATANIPNATIKWFANATGGNPVFTGATFTTPALNSATNYYVEVVNNATACVSASRQQVQVQLIQPLPAPVVSVGATNNTSITFNWTAVTGATGYEVSINNGQTYAAPGSGSNGLTHTVTGLQLNQSVTILVRATGAAPCQQSSSASATAQAISLSDEVYVPNAFSPNGDGKNDMVHVHSESLKTLNFYVYSQWGELLFTSTNATNGWDGTYKGMKQPVGVYIYYVKAVMNDGHEVNKKGTITLLR